METAIGTQKTLTTIPKALVPARTTLLPTLKWAMHP